MKQSLSGTARLDTNPSSGFFYEEEAHELVVHYTQTANHYDSYEIEYESFELDGKDITIEELEKRFDPVKVQAAIEWATE